MRIREFDYPPGTFHRSIPSAYKEKGVVVMNSANHPLKSDLRAGMKRGKLVSAREAVGIIKSGDVVALGGFIGVGIAEEMLVELEKRFLETGEPRNLTLLYASGLGDAKERGVNRLAHEGLLKRVVCGHWGMTPKLARLAFDNKIEGYNLPQGVISALFRDTAAHRPRTITEVGLGTFVDPRNGGGKINKITTEDLVEVIEFDGREYLSYKPIPINVAIIRATTADLDGNLTLEKEALTLDGLAIAMAARNSGGFILAQVERIADRGALPMRNVKIPGILVDCVSISQPENHRQTWATQYNPAYAGEFRFPVESIPPIPLDERKIIARRAAFELHANSIVNLGIGVPEGIASVAAEEGILDFLTLTAEPGVIGGIPAGGMDFGAATNVHAIIDQAYQFDFYDGGGLDVAFLGLAQADAEGNLNVSRFGPKLAGAGGFINISQNAKKVVFCGSFTAGDLQVVVKDDQLQIISEGKSRKFIESVEQITFAGKVARDNRKQVLYITERCVFVLAEEGLVLTEIAPGIDLQRDILDLMDFKPKIASNLKIMDQRIFKEGIMGLKEDLLAIPIADRLTYQREDNIFFVNFEGLSIRSEEDIEEIRRQISGMLAPIGKRVYTIVNYDNFDILPELVDKYMEMVREVVTEYYENVTRYSTGAFMRMKLGDTLKERDLAPHIFETPEEARQALLQDDE